MSQLGEALVPIRATLDKLDQDLAGAKRKIDGALNKISGFDLGISTAVANKSIELFQSGMSLAVDTMADGVTKASDLEAQLDTVGAISGATEEQVAGLSRVINELGLNPKLKVSALEAAQAVEELVAGGVALDDVMNGAAEGTVALANATGADFALAATVAADSMSLFKIEAKDLDQVIDGVAAVAVQSKFDVNDYAMALAQAGGIAATSGVEFEDFNTTIAAIAPLFASGSDAGTSFKVFLQRLIPASKEAAGVMKELGLMTEEEGNRFFDAQGNLKSMADVAGLLDEAFSGLSEAQRNSAMQTLFGTDAMRAAVGLMDTGKEGFTQMQQAMSQTSGMDAAAQRMTNLSGQTEILNGVVESLQIQYGQKLIPKLTEMAQRATDFASTQGPALVESLANLTLGAIDLGERGGPVLETVFGTVTRLGDSADRLATTALKLGENFGIISENAEQVDVIMTILNKVVEISMAPWNALIVIIDLVNQNFEAADRNFKRIKAAIDGMSDSTRSLTDRLGELGASLLDLVIPDNFTPGSPTPFENGIRGITAALKEMPDFSDKFNFNTPQFPALSGATAGAGGSGGNTSIVNIDGVSATRINRSDPADEAIRMTVGILRQKLQVVRR